MLHEWSTTVSAWRTRGLRLVKVDLFHGAEQKKTKYTKMDVGSRELRLRLTRSRLAVLIKDEMDQLSRSIFPKTEVTVGSTVRTLHVCQLDNLVLTPVLNWA